MHSSRSADGTVIAFDTVGAGPPLILVNGALHDSSATRILARMLAPRFAVTTYDRRGRGASGDAAGYATGREIEDLAALLARAGGAASVYGHSSGGVLALEAAASGLPITRLAVYEPPYVADGGLVKRRRTLTVQVATALAAGRRGDAVQQFLAEAMELRPAVVAMLRASRQWAAMEALAPTLDYDLALVNGGVIPQRRLASIGVPVLFLDGAASPAWIHAAVPAAAAAVPGACYESLPGQDHSPAAAVIAPVLARFFTSTGALAPG